MSPEQMLREAAQHLDRARKLLEDIEAAIRNHGKKMKKPKVRSR